jgi:hypothetical protein
MKPAAKTTNPVNHVYPCLVYCRPKKSGAAPKLVGKALFTFCTIPRLSILRQTLRHRLKCELYFPGRQNA